MSRDTIGVVIGTFGDRDAWQSMIDRALASVESQTQPVDQIHLSHEPTLQLARNRGAVRCFTDWLIFLDADDELDVRYVEEMTEGLDAEIRVPRTLGIYEDGSQDEAPTRIPRRDLRVANFVVIGAMQRRDLFRRVGGFPDYPILEDWALWRKLAAIGAKFQDSPAVYRIHVRPGSRNHDQALHSSVYRQIQKEIPL